MTSRPPSVERRKKEKMVVAYIWPSFMDEDYWLIGTGCDITLEDHDDHSPHGLVKESELD